jgi:biofilm PGA synthesis protein PgaD
MDQSRPRHTPVKPIIGSKLKSPLIERPDLQSVQQRTLYGLLTLIFWGMWFYLWLPLIALLAWMLGMQQAFKYMVVLDGYKDVIRLIGMYGLIILLLGGGLVLWAVYNIVRFRGVERRTEALPVTAKEIGQHFEQDPKSVAVWQGEQSLYVTHNHSGHIDQVEILSEVGTL